MYNGPWWNRVFLPLLTKENMDSEKKYNEAVKEAVKQLEFWSKRGDREKAAARMAIEAIFPQLKESEDEKIRRELKEAFESYDIESKWNGIPIRSIFSWLEKKKEHPMSAEEVLIKAGLKPYKDGNQWCILAGDNIQEGICGFGDTIDEALYQFLMEVLEMQKEQKPKIYIPKFRNGDKIKLKGSNLNLTITNIEGSRYYGKGWSLDIVSADESYELVEQKPAEWNEEDEKMIDTIVSALGQYIDYKAVSGTDSGYAIPRYSKEIDWLKSIRPQPKQEKSDYITPHKQFFKWIYDRLVNVHKENPDVDYMISFKKRIEELSFDNPSWKPSKQEKGALKTAIHVLTNERNFPKTAGHLQAILDAFEGKESRKDWKPSEEQLKALKYVAYHLMPDENYRNEMFLLYEQLQKL